MSSAHDVALGKPNPQSGKIVRESGKIVRGRPSLAYRRNRKTNRVRFASRATAQGDLLLAPHVVKPTSASSTKCADTSRREAVGSCYARSRACRLPFARQDKVRRRLRADCV